MTDRQMDRRPGEKQYVSQLLRGRHNTSLRSRIKQKLFAYYCRLLITFANSLKPDQARQNVGPNLVQTVLHSDGISDRIF